MTNNLHIQELIAQGEGYETEFLAKFDMNRIGTKLVGFLNGNGGTVLVGIDANGHVLGVSDIETHLSNLKEFLLNEILPESPVDFEIANLNGKKILIAKVFQGSRQPYIFQGHIYYRNGKITRKATSRELSQLIHERAEAQKHWERRTDANISWSDLDAKLIAKILKESKKMNKTTYNGDDSLGFLTHYGLYQNNAFTNACVILFAKNPSKYFPQSRVQLIEYSSNKLERELARNVIYDGNLFVIHDAIERYFNAMGIRSLFDDNQWKRIDFSFPIKALREGLNNALIHRDYSSSSSGLSIHVYPGKVVISNSGVLPDALEIRDLKKDHRSHPQNPDITHIVYLTGLIDRMGKGTIRVVQECKDAGLKDPTWSQTKDGISLTFNGPRALQLKKPKNEAVSEVVDEAINEAVKTLINEAVSEVVNEVVSEAVSNRLTMEVMYLLEENGSGIKKLMEYFHVGRSTIQRDMALVKKAGLIEFIGSPKTGSYQLTTKTQKILLDITGSEDKSL